MQLSHVLWPGCSLNLTEYPTAKPAECVRPVMLRRSSCALSIRFQICVYTLFFSCISRGSLPSGGCGIENCSGLFGA